MSTVKCALLGFPSCDVELFQTFFKVTATVGFSFAHTPQESEADILIVDASDAAAFDRIVHSKSGTKALVVGDTAAAFHWPTLPRPFRLVSVLHILQGLAAES